MFSLSFILWMKLYAHYFVNYRGIINDWKSLENIGIVKMFQAQLLVLY